MTDIEWGMSSVRTVDEQRVVVAHANVDGHRIKRVRVHSTEPFTPCISQVYYADGDNAACATLEDAVARAQQKQP